MDKIKTKKNLAPRMRHKETLTAGDKLLTVVCYIIFTVCAIICIYPFYYIFINTISANDLSARGEVLFLPKGLHLQNYISMLSINGLFQALKITVLRTVIGTITTVFASAFLGFMFTQKEMWLRTFWYRLVIATMYFNAGIIPWYITMRNLGLTNNFWGYVLPLIISPFNIVLTKTFVESVPHELQEAASIDGAGILTIFFRIIIPVIKPILATVAIFAAVGQWNAFQDTLLLVTDTKLYSLQFLLYQYLNQASSLKSLASQGSSSLASAASSTSQTSMSIRMTITIIVVLPILCIYPFFRRYFEKGIMLGAVKG